ncbi:hypothetical protein G3T14_11005 [Methylobacterium sp. BTF04]|nr:hypothetical protein [Methylobacterium sp. BTF04]
MHAGSLSLDAFLRRRSGDRRLARLTHDVALPKGYGLEFGPAANPTSLPDGLKVSYVDHARDAHAGLAGAAPIDHAWAGSGSLAAVLGQTGYDFAIAAQVAQYVPNLLGWFRGIHAVLRPGGVLNIALPDQRFMFDVGRAHSTIAELVEADLLSYTRPSPRQLFAHTHEARALEPAQIWAGEDPAQAPRFCGEASLSLAFLRAKEEIETGHYVDCHCWVFTPLSFLDAVEGATLLGLFPFVLNQIGGSEPGAFEFYVSMRRAVEEDPQTRSGMQSTAISHLRTILERQRRMAALMGKC